MLSIRGNWGNTNLFGGIISLVHAEKNWIELLWTVMVAVWCHRVVCPRRVHRVHVIRLWNHKPLVQWSNGSLLFLKEGCCICSETITWANINAYIYLQYILVYAIRTNHTHTDSSLIIPYIIPYHATSERVIHILVSLALFRKQYLPLFPRS